MKLGAIFPITEIGTDPVVIRDYAQAIEDIGYDHLVVFDHVLGADPSKHELWGPYTHEFQFHEPFVLMGYLAAVTQKIELATGIVIAPQRQTALLAKQAAEVDVLSGGRLRLGIGIGWNQVEYQALGQDFSTRGRRVEEQIELLRQLWSNELVTFEGKWDTIIDAGINPLPVQQPLPIWMGGWADPMIRRIARIGDGWFAFFKPDDTGKHLIGKLRQYAEEADRDPADIGIEAWITVNNADIQAGWNQKPEDMLLRSADEWCEEIAAWQDLGATHLACWTMYGGLSSDQHIDVARRFKEAVDSM
ncbi:MAG: LLM class F420-dependent oxidoreductase [Gammaproteobacteria bacterium]|nr:LLM class F420-dependent oxidoreductase [Gammaproteobacteria bacterium]MBQ0838923.1 LLM class F420-dependent oxidoreductase [Gammaproteobacteria bacterium]